MNIQFLDVIVERGIYRGIFMGELLQINPYSLQLLMPIQKDRINFIKEAVKSTTRLTPLQINERNQFYDRYKKFQDKNNKTIQGNPESTDWD